MLKLTRYPGQAITIGEEVEVVVLSVQGRNVRLGIKAPGDQKILRTELEPDRENESGRHREGE